MRTSKRMDDDSNDEHRDKPPVEPAAACTPKTFTPGGSATVPTYLWTADVKYEDRMEKPRTRPLAVINIDSSPEEVSTVRKAFRKLRLKRDVDEKCGTADVIKPTAEKALERIGNLRPWKDAEGAKLRKKQRRRVLLAIKNKRNKNAAKSRRSRKVVSIAKASCPVADEDDDCLLTKLIEHVILSLRGKRIYTRSFVDYIARVGTTPSAGGARGPIALILSQIGGCLSVQRYGIECFINVW